MVQAPNELKMSNLIYPDKCARMLIEFTPPLNFWLFIIFSSSNAKKVPKKDVFSLHIRYYLQKWGLKKNVLKYVLENLYIGRTLGPLVCSSSKHNILLRWPTRAVGRFEKPGGGVKK